MEKIACHFSSSFICKPWIFLLPFLDFLCFDAIFFIITGFGVSKKTSKTSFETPEKNSLLLTNFATHKLFPVSPPPSKVYFHRLRPNIRKKILHTDLHTFPYKIVWENQSTFPLVTIFTLITFGSSLLSRGGLLLPIFTTLNSSVRRCHLQQLNKSFHRKEHVKSFKIKKGFTPFLTFRFSL